MNIRGEMSLTVLMTLILSSIAVLFLVLMLLPFLQSPTNLGIAKDNAKSIVEFVEYSDDKYSGRNCYTLLKLSNLENYQMENLDEKYFLIINERGVGVYELEILPLIIKDRTILNNIKPKFFEGFSSNKEIYMEDLSYLYKIGEGFFDFAVSIGPGLLDLISILARGEDLGLVEGFEDSKRNLYYIETTDSDFVVLTPQFYYKIANFEIDFLPFSPNENTLSMMNIERFEDPNEGLYSIFNVFDLGEGVAETVTDLKNQIYVESSFLSYNPSKGLIPLYSYNAENYALGRLCSQGGENE